MKILFFNRVFPPADGATGHLLKELTVALAAKGWSITVITGPAENEPRSSVVDGVAIERVRSFRFSRASFLQRFLSYLSLYPAMLWRALWLPKQDVIVTMTDPPLHLLLGLIVGWLRGGRLIHWAQDLYPELAEELGVLGRNGIAARICRTVSTFALRRQERVVAVGRCMRNRLLARGVGERVIRVIPNWSQNAPESQSDFRARHGLQGKVILMYSGNLGMAHSFEAIVDAADALQHSNPEILFLFVGTGPRLRWVEQQTESRRLPNIQFLPSQPLAELSAALRGADIHLVSMLENLSGLVVPSKAYGIFAAGRPCFFIGPRESEIAQLILENQCGEVFGSSEASRLIEALRGWSANPTSRASAGDRARLLAANFTSAAAAEVFIQLLHEATSAECSSSEAPLLALQQIPSRTQK
jgi:colanic acid biosynthesis glycosyl transferase WcaI